MVAADVTAGRGSEQSRYSQSALVAGYTITPPYRCVANARIARMMLTSMLQCQKKHWKEGHKEDCKF